MSGEVRAQTRGSAERSFLRPFGWIERTAVRRTHRAWSVTALTTWRHVDAAALASLVFVSTALNLLWVALDNRGPYWDMARHLGDSLVIRNSFSLAHPFRFLTTYVYYPPFAYWVTDALYVVLGTAQWVAIASQAVFLALLVCATYGIGKVLWNRRVGLLSAFFVATTPLFVSMFKWYMLDAPLAAMTALALYLLLRSESFSNRRFSLLFGVVCGLGILTKWTFPLTIWLPALAGTAVAIKTDITGRSLRSVVNAGGAAVITFAISAPWFISNWTQFRADEDRYNTRAADLEGDPQLRTLRSLLWYAWNLLDEQLYLIPFLLFVVGIVYLFRKNDSAARNLYPVLTVVGTYLAFTFVQNKDYRFTMPILPAVAVVAVSWFEFLRPALRRWFSGGVIAYGVGAFLAISFGTGLLPKDWVIHLKPRSYTSDLVAFMPGYDAGSATRAQGIVLFAQHGWLVGPPSAGAWHEDDVFRQMAARSNQPAFWFWPSYPAGDSIWLNTWSTRYYSLRYGATWVGSPNEARFLVIRGAAPAGLTRGFVTVSRYVLPDRGTLSLYERA